MRTPAVAVPLAAEHSRARTVLRHDLPASAVLVLIAIPLSLGIAVASGASCLENLLPCGLRLRLSPQNGQIQDEKARHRALLVYPDGRRI